MTAVMIEGITLRPATPDDYAFMRRLYGAARAEEMKHFPMTDEMKEVFLDQQFAAQTEHYSKHYPTARVQISEREATPIGRFYIDAWESEIRVVDIALMPEYRNLGIGSALMREALDEGRRAGKPVTIHVEAFNPALQLYGRLGFKAIKMNGAYYLMEWKPE